MEGVKSLDVRPRGTSRRRGRGTLRRWRRELGRPSPARRLRGGVGRVASYNGWWAGKWAGRREGVGGGRSTARADGTTEPAAMGRAAASSARRVQGKAGECGSRL